MPRFQRFASALAGWIVLQVCSAAFAAEQPAAAPIEISAHGRVAGPDGKPVAGAKVVLREWASQRYGENVFGEIDDRIAETQSDADGNFRFDKVAAKPWKQMGAAEKPWDLIATAAGFGPAWVHLKDVAGSAAVELRLAPAKSMTGKLVDADGKPVAGCVVTLAGITPLGPDSSNGRFRFDEPESLDLWRSRVFAAVTTDAEGSFAFDDLPAERRVMFWTDHPDFVDGVVFAATTDVPQPDIKMPAIEEGKQVTASHPVHAAGFKHPLKPGSRVHGVVVRGDSAEREPRARVSLSGPMMQFSRADEEGEFEFTAPPGDDYTVSVSPETEGFVSSRTPLVLPKGEVTELRISLQKGQPVQGVVVDGETGTGVAQVSVTYLPEKSDGNWSPAKAVTTDADGGFTIVVPAGAGTLRVGGTTERHPTHDVPDFYRHRNPDQVSPGHTVTINVVAGQATEPVRLTVTRGLVVRGVAVDADGKPLPLVSVEVVDQFGRPERTRKTLTDEAGRFELGGFPPFEEVQLKVTDPVSHLRASATINADPTAKTSRLIDLGEIKLRGTATVIGVVLGDGKPLAGARVSLSSVTGQDGRYMQTSQDATATTDAEGKFTLDGIDPARECFVHVDCDGFTDGGSNTIQLKSGETRELPPFNVQSRSAFVAGVVVDLDGKPVPGVTVSAGRRDGGSISFGRNGPPPLTDAEGRFRIEDLPNVPLELLAYIRAPVDHPDMTIHFPARVSAEPGQTDVRILLDPKLQRPLP